MGDPLRLGQHGAGHQGLCRINADVVDAELHPWRNRARGTAREGALPKERMRGSLKRIAALKSIVEQPLPLDLDRFNSLSDEISELNTKLGYRYGGSV